MEASRGDRFARRAASVLPALALGGADLTLGSQAPGAPLLLAVVVVSAVAASAWLRTLRRGSAADLWMVPALVGSGIVAGLARLSLLDEILAAAVALALLYWIGAERVGLGLPATPAGGLLLPGLAVALAISVTLFLPAGPALVGVASLILVALFLGLAAVLAVVPGGTGTEGRAQEVTRGTTPGTPKGVARSPTKGPS